MQIVVCDSLALADLHCDAEVLADLLALVEALIDADVFGDSLAHVDALMDALVLADSDAFLLGGAHRLWTYFADWLALAVGPLRQTHC